MNATCWEVFAQNSVYMSSGCITQNIYPHCSVVFWWWLKLSAGFLFFTLLQRLDVAAGEGDADAVDGDLGLNRCLASVLECLHEWKNKTFTQEKGKNFAAHQFVKLRSVTRKLNKPLQSNQKNGQHLSAPHIIFKFPRYTNAPHG